MAEVVQNKLLLISPVFFDYEKKIQRELEVQGWDVTFIDTRPSNSFLTKVLIRLGLNYLIRSQLRNHHDRILNLVKNNDFSKILFVNPEGFNERFFQDLRELTEEADVRLYLWDSIDNKPLIKPTLKYYNKCFTFDRSDASKVDNFNFLPLFYSNDYENISLKNKRDYDFVFIGTVHSQRMKVVQYFRDFSVRNNNNFFYYLFIQSRIIYWVRRLTDVSFSQYKDYSFNFKSLSVNEIIDIFSSTKSVIDIEHDKQNGLTMRTFEVLAAGIKIITTNKDIVNYDIYHPDNVHIIDRCDIEFDSDFLNIPFRPYPPEIIGKYKLSAWVKSLVE
ncbi:CgeB family protein [Enterobacter mori]|uniref:hypothetical protein n=1 Tax=Enterobacter mori TaxID=539813 RepID=UPI0039786670